MKEKDKKHGMLSDMAKHAKMSVLKDVHNMAAQDMAGKLHGLKKVSVMSNSPAGLQHGLDKAKELLGHAVEGESPVEEHDEQPDMADAVDDVMEPKEMPESEGDPEAEDMDEAEEALESHPMNDAGDMSHVEPGDEHELDDAELDKRIAHLHMLKNKKRMSK